MKLFNHKPTWSQLVRERANLSDISAASVQMKQVIFLDNVLLKLKTMEALKPNADIATAIDVLTASTLRISKVVDEAMNQSFPIVSNRAG